MTALASMAVVKGLFPEQVIAQFGNLAWHLRSPKLSMYDFFLWGHLKANVYTEKPHTLEELNAAKPNLY